MATEPATESHSADDAAHSRTQSNRPGRFATLRKAWAAAKEDRLPLVAAGVAFYAFLAIVPTLIAGVLLYGLVGDPDQIANQVEKYASALPTSAQELLTDQMTALVETPRQSLGIGLIIALAVALWSASNGTTNMMTAVNLAYGGAEERGFIKRRALGLLFTVGAIVFVLLAVTLVAALPAIVNALDLPSWVGIVVQVARWVLLLVLVVTALSVLYRWAPESGSHRWKWLSFGAVIATIIWVVVSVGFSIYVDNFGSYGQTYGPLAGVVVLLLWLWLSSYAALFGAEVNAVQESYRAPGVASRADEHTRTQEQHTTELRATEENRPTVAHRDPADSAAAERLATDEDRRAAEYRQEAEQRRAAANKPAATPE